MYSGDFCLFYEDFGGDVVVIDSRFSQELLGFAKSLLNMVFGAMVSIVLLVGGGCGGGGSDQGSIDLKETKATKLKAKKTRATKSKAKQRGGKSVDKKRGHIRNRWLLRRRLGLPEGNLCGGVAMDTPEEVARSPRKNKEMEQLSLFVSDGVVADQKVYERVVEDVKAIHQIEPETRTIVSMNCRYVTSEMIIYPTRESLDAMIMSGSFKDPLWKCLTRIYRLRETELGVFARSLVLSFEGVLDIYLLSSMFMMVDGIRYAVQNRKIVSCRTISLAQGWLGEYHYIFEKFVKTTKVLKKKKIYTSNTKRVYYHFVSWSAGAVHPHGKHIIDYGNLSDGDIVCYIPPSKQNPRWLKYRSILAVQKYWSFML